MNTVNFSKKESDESYSIKVLENILGFPIQAKELTEMNLLGTRTREEVLKNKI